MAALAEALEAGGIERADFLDNEGKEETTYASVAFYGDESAGRRAVEVAWSSGFQPTGLVRDWMIVGEEICEASWLMLFD